MKISSEFGNEPYYALWATSTAIFFPIHMSLPLLFLWGFGMYCGQYLKDNLRLPRPGLTAPIDTAASAAKPTTHPSETALVPCVPRVVRLETHYAAEFGFPSTHALGALSLPLCSVLTAAASPDTAAALNTALGRAWLALQLWWLLLTPVSRLYLGVHSLLDIAAGAAMGVLLAIPVYLFRAALAAALAEVPGAVALLGAAAAALWVYPRTDRWTNALGDTALILGTMSGACLGIALRASSAAPEAGAAGTLANAVRLVLTVVAVYSSRILNKTNVYKTLRICLGVPAVPVPPDATLLKERVAAMGSAGKWTHDLGISDVYFVEGTEKFISFFIMGVLASYVMPVVLDSVGL
jgi:membrane-associated phospholipid phosphatase